MLEAGHGVSPSFLKQIAHLQCLCPLTSPALALIASSMDVDSSTAWPDVSPSQTHPEPLSPCPGLYKHYKPSSIRLAWRPGLITRGAGRLDKHIRILLMSINGSVLLMSRPASPTSNEMTQIMCVCPRALCVTQPATPVSLRGFPSV